MPSGPHLLGWVGYLHWLGWFGWPLETIDFGTKNC